MFWTPRSRILGRSSFSSIGQVAFRQKDGLEAEGEGLLDPGQGAARRSGPRRSGRPRRRRRHRADRALFLREETTARTTPRSAAGSSIVEPAGDVEVDVLAPEAEPYLPLDDGQEHRRPEVVEPDGHPPGVAGEQGRRDERLDLGEQRPRSFDRRDDHAPRFLGRPLLEKKGRGIGDGLEARRAHLEDGQLGDRPEPVLQGPQHPVAVVTLALEEEDDIDHVLERFRPGQRTLLGDVPDEERGDVVLLGEPEDLRWPPPAPG